MLHLLTHNQKKMILNEYRKRLAVLGCFFIILLALTGIIFLIPSYMVAEEKFGKIDAQKIKLTSELAALSGDKTGDIVSEISEKTAALSPLGAIQTASGVFDAFSSKVGAGIAIQHLGYVLNADKSLTFDVGGSAASRDSLIAFTNGLSASNIFTGAKIPLSTLRNERNIDFTFKLGVRNAASTTAQSI